MSDISIAARPEIIRDTSGGELPYMEKCATPFERLYRIGALRKAVILLALALVWEAYGRWLDNPLLFPPFSATFEAFVENIGNGILPARAMTSLKTLLAGYCLGIALAALLAPSNHFRSPVFSYSANCAAPISKLSPR